jgi:DNA helicase-2/ATP-dependent DNA helicase PcrA
VASGISFEHPFTLVNAPAGSGKTTAISNSIRKLLETKEEKRILCITYTNRATEQLTLKVDDDRVDISTIHSFISNFMVPFFKKKEILELYHDFFEERISQILASTETRDTERVERYRRKKEIISELTLDTNIIMKSLNEIYYNESQFSSYLYGGLSHDDLLVFAKEMFHKYLKINKIISQKYSHVFIDEYQDTQSEILNLFYNATLGTSTKLILMGDEMQQIYNDRVDDFETILHTVFYKDNSLKKNWRSKEYIVNILNNLYFDTTYKQDPIHKQGQKPTVHIVRNMDDIEIQEGVLQLVLYNSEMFDYIGAGDLFRAFNERYKISDKYSSKQILTDMSMENPDSFMIVLIFITDIVELYDQKKYGELIKRLTEFKYVKVGFWRINKHLDKVNLQSKLRNLSAKLKEDIGLITLLEYLQEDIIDAFHIEEIINNINENEKFKEKIDNINYIQFKNCYGECKKHSVSTQHAVKGEGHDAIALKISDGNNPNVRMHLFLELWSKDLFDYRALKIMRNEIRTLKGECENKVGLKLSSSSINSGTYQTHNDDYDIFIDSICNVFKDQQGIFDILFRVDFENYRNRKNVTNFKKCLAIVNKIEGIILAYKLFYVGCSRAKEKLDVYIKGENIKDFETEFSNRMGSIGFLIENHTHESASSST